MITYTLFYISVNVGTFTCIVSFSIRTEINNIQDYVGLYTKYHFFFTLSLVLCFFIFTRSFSISKYFRKIPFILTRIRGIFIFFGFNRTPDIY